MGKNNITISDVADALGISKTTVSRAISGKGRIGEETKTKVLDYIEKHGYRPNVIAKGLAQSRTFNICVVMPGDYNVVDLTFFQECIFGIQEIAGIMEYDVLLSICKDNEIGSLKRIISNGKVDGVILMRTYVEDKQIEYLKLTRMPFVTIGASTYPDVVQVDYNHIGACREMTSYILAKGFTKVALIGNDMTQMVTQNRYRGFREAFERNHQQIDESLLYLNMDNKIMMDRAVEEILAKRAECILCMDDAICSRVLKKLREMNITIPGDVRVASFYNSSVLENNVPSISSLSFDAKEIGMVACRRLLDLIENAQNVEQVTLLPYEVILKESTK